MLRKTCFYLINLFIFSFVCFGQNASNWRTYVSPKDDFSVSMPEKVKEMFLVVKDSSNKEKFFGGHYHSAFNGQYYYIFTAPIAKEFKNTVKPSLPQMIKSFVDENTNDSNIIKIREHFGTQWNFKDKEGFTHKVVAIQAINRAFVFHIFGEDLSDTDLARFFSSIRFYNSSNNKKLKILLKKSLIKNRQFENDNIAKLTLPPPAPKTTFVEPPLAADSSLRILSNPKPPYSDLARFYMIEGIVELEASFSSEGRVGSITTLKKLPLGLTQNAIEAAKKTEFIPATKSKIPITVKKKIQYTFKLF